MITIEPVAKIYNDFKEKFGIPRQSGMTENQISTIVFEEKYRDDNALRGLEGYSHLWLLWLFDDKNSQKKWSATVRPPRLGGNKRMGIFATRSPYHPNGIGLSCVKIESVEKTDEQGTVIKVSGADLLDTTPIIDIKPYLPYTDSHPEALSGFAEECLSHKLCVHFDCDISMLNKETLKSLVCVLELDPRPSYQDSADRVYSMKYSRFDVKFLVDGKQLHVVDIVEVNGCE